VTCEKIIVDRNVKIPYNTYSISEERP